MRIVVFGAGAIGSLFGGLLSRWHDVILVGRGEHLDAVKRGGLHIESDGESLHLHPRITGTLPADEPVDLLAISVKAYDLEKACSVLSSHRPPPRWILCLQNGIGNEDLLATCFPLERIARALIYQGVAIEGPGRLHWYGKGVSYIGLPFRGGEEEVELDAMAESFTSSGFATRISREIRREIWRKLIVNAAINPLGAIAGLPNGALVRSPALLSLLHAVVAEAQEVARAEAGYDFRLAEKTSEIALQTGGNRNSMLLDLETRGKTEIDFLNGAIVRMAARLGIAVPVNETLVSLIRGMEEAARHGWAKRAAQGGRAGR